MPQWTAEQVEALAPDSASVVAGRGLASPAKWESSGASEAAVWGEAKGSGAKPYQTAVDLAAVAFKCTCPSRKFPCKHALGLLLRHAKGEVGSGDPPAWVTDWLEKRSQKAVEKAERPPRDDEAAEKRSQRRWANILSGLDECEAFLQDAVAQGLLATQSARSWEQMAARMVDAQAPGVARRLRQIEATIGVGADWAPRAAARLGNLALLMEAARGLERLEEGERADVLASVGIATRKEDLPEDEFVVDVWDVLGQAVEAEDRLTVCRSWLRGRGTGRWGVQLAFSAAGQPFGARPLPGQAFSAAAQFFPSAWPLRVHVEDFPLTEFMPRPGGTWSDGFEETSRALSRNPWIEQTPVLLRNARLGREGERWFVVDEAGISIPAQDRSDGRWRLLALSGNGPCSVFGEWAGGELLLLAAWGEWGYVAL